MICETCGNKEAIRIRSTNGIEFCDRCNYNAVRGKVGAHHGNRRVPDHFNEQLGERITQSNYKEVEKKHKVKLVNQPFQEYRKANKQGEYMKKANKQAKREKQKRNFVKELKK